MKNFGNNFFMVKDKLKFSIFCLVIFCVVCLPLTNCYFDKFATFQNVTYSFYTTSCNFEFSNASVVKNGNSAIVTCSGENAFDVKSQITNLLGESIKIERPTQSALSKIDGYINKFLLFTEVLNGTSISYAYDPSLANFVVVDGNKVNLQVAKTDFCVVVGHPLILGSF